LSQGQFAAFCRSSELATVPSRRAVTKILTLQHRLCAGTFLAASRFALSKLGSLTLPNQRRGATGLVQMAPVTKYFENGDQPCRI